MLHALTHRKATLRPLFQEGTRVPFEDILTSTVFGPLAFMSVDDRTTCLRLMLGYLGIAHEESGDASLSLWERCTTDARLQRKLVEPDILVRSGSRIVGIVEVKWDAPLSVGELAAQWAALSASERQSSFHLLLVREPKRYQASIDEDEASLRELGIASWRRRLHVTTWKRMASALKHVSARLGGTPTSLWAESCMRLISQEEFHVQLGWSQVQILPVALSEWRFMKEGDHGQR